MKAKLEGKLTIAGKTFHIPRQDVVVDDGTGERHDPVALDRLSAGQRNVVRLLALGMKTRKIAQELGLSVHTIRNHLKAAMKAFDVHTQLELLKAAGYLD